MVLWCYPLLCGAETASGLISRCPQLQGAEIYTVTSPPLSIMYPSTSIWRLNLQEERLVDHILAQEGRRE